VPSLAPLAVLVGLALRAAAGTREPWPAAACAILVIFGLATTPGVPELTRSAIMFSPILTAFVPRLTERRITLRAAMVLLAALAMIYLAAAAGRPSGARAPGGDSAAPAAFGPGT
jgi:hypothetical protein